MKAAAPKRPKVVLASGKGNPTRATYHRKGQAAMKFDRAALARVTGAAGDGLQEAAELLEQESNALVPDLSGALQASSTVSVDRGDGTAAVSYDTPYAARQHEDLGARHDDGTAKFLEVALNSNSRELLNMMARELRRGIQ